MEPNLLTTMLLRLRLPLLPVGACRHLAVVILSRGASGRVNRAALSRDHEWLDGYDSEWANRLTLDATDYGYTMIGPTGTHTLDASSSVERVLTHWEGFVENNHQWMHKQADTGPY